PRISAISACPSLCFSRSSFRRSPMWLSGMSLDPPRHMILHFKHCKISLSSEKRRSARRQTSDTESALPPPRSSPNVPAMIRPAFSPLAALPLAAASPALAQTSSAPTRLSGVTVMAPAPTLPMVVSTYPTDGKAVTGGVLILKVTFDQKMAPDGWDYGK